MSGYRTIEVRRLSGALGAELHGVDLARVLPDETVAEIRQAFLEHLVVFFRDQTLSPAEFMAFARRMLGGVPVIVDGHVIGAAGVGSGTGEQDLEVAKAAIAALPDAKQF